MKNNETKPNLGIDFPQKALSSISFKKKALCTAVYLSLSSGAFAAEQPQELAETTVKSEDENEYKVDRSASHKLTQNIIDTPKTLTIVNESVLRDQGVTNLNDALRNISGVSTFGGGEGGGGNITTNDIATIRGFSVNGSIYIDGIRDISGYSRDMFNTEQIEVSKGANSSFTGKASAGGSINLVTKRAKKDNFTNINGLLDSSDTIRASLDHNSQFNDKVSARINLLTTSGGDVFGNGIEDYKTNAFASSLLFSPSEQTAITFDLLFMKQDNTPMLGLPWVTESAAGPFIADPDGDGPLRDQGGTNLAEGPIPENLWDNYYGVKSRDFEDIKTNIVTLVVEHEFSSDAKLISQTRLGNNESKAVISRPRFNRQTDTSGNTEPFYTTDVDVDWTQNIDSETELFVTQLDFIFNIMTGSIKHDLVLGGELYEEELTKERVVRGSSWDLSQRFIDLYNPITDQVYSGTMDVWPDPERVEGKGWAVYALDTIEFSPAWELSAGIRYENYEAEGEKYLWRRVDGNWTNFFYPGLYSEGSFTSWHTALVHKPSVNGSIYLGYANTQEPPGGDLAFSGWNEDSVNAQSKFEPKESKNLELGIKWQFFDEQLLLSSAYFVTEKTEVDRDADSNYILSGELEAKGIELSISGKLNDQLEVIASYTHQETEVVKDFDPEQQGDGLTAAPEDTASLWLTYQLDNLKLGGGAVYSSGDTYWRRSRAYFETGSFTLWNLMASYQFTDQLNLQLNVLNATDETYITDYSARGHFRPGNPREFKLSVGYQF